MAILGCETKVSTNLRSFRIQSIHSFRNAPARPPTKSSLNNYVLKGISEPPRGSSSTAGGSSASESMPREKNENTRDGSDGKRFGNMATGANCVGADYL